MNEKRYTYRIQWLVLIGAAILVLLFMAVWITEGTNKEWRKVQREYAEILRGRATDNGAVPDMERGIFQVELPQFDRVDRCVSCHNGIGDATMERESQPHRSHQGDFLLNHPLQQYGCTICHGGQGRALTREDAFGRSPGSHWPHPLLEQPYIQASCGKCHLAVFDHSTGEAEKMDGMEMFVKGKSLFSQEGCLGCHKARGVGGILGPDLTRQGEKTKHEYSFQNISSEQTVSNWIKEHFKDPEMVSPGSQMLQINLVEEELEALATFVMGLSKPDIPFDYFTIQTLNEFKGIRDTIEGPKGYAYLCSACHGKEGEGKGYKEYKTGIPSIGNADFLRVASDDYIRFTIEKGRSLRQMGSWTSAISGMSDKELDGIVESLTGEDHNSNMVGTTYSRGNTADGDILFNDLCRACHGEKGKGEVAVALNQKGFLSIASDDFILETILKGRGNTAMPGWAHLGTESISHLLAAIRSWDSSRPAGSSVFLPEPDLEEGALRYHFLCSRCHGEFGRGETGPAIMNPDFLLAADNMFLYETISKGRQHTAMFGWSADVYNQEKLGPADISSIIGFMRKSALDPLTYIYPGSNPGNREAGAGIFAEHCAECHGSSGEGIKGPALNNQEFLSAASNGYLMGTMTIGRNGTAMPSWGYGQDDYPALSGKERQDLVAYVRSWQRIRIKY